MNDCFDYIDDMCAKIYEEMSKAEDERIFNEMKDKGQIDKPVLICSRKIKYQIESMLPNKFCMLATDLCEDDKVYMVTDKRVADNIRNIVKAGE